HQHAAHAHTMGRLHIGSSILALRDSSKGHPQSLCTRTGKRTGGLRVLLRAPPPPATGKGTEPRLPGRTWRLEETAGTLSAPHPLAEPSMSSMNGWHP